MDSVSPSFAYCFQKKRLDIARFLIDKGADIEAYCNKYELFVKEIVPENFQLSSWQKLTVGPGLQKVFSEMIKKRFYERLL